MTASLLLGNAAAAAAADFCLDSPLSLVLKSFTPPGRGACKETRGFYREALVWMSGTACGSSGGYDITFAQTGVAGTVLVTDTFTLNRQTMSGPGVLCVVGGQCFPDTWTKMACQPTTVPVPGGSDGAADRAGSSTWGARHAPPIPPSLRGCS